MTRLNAYTLVEALLVLVLTGMVVSLAAGVSSVVSAESKRMGNQAADGSSVNLALAQLHWDFERSTSATWNSPYLRLTLDGSEKISYRLGSTDLIRSIGPVQDTFSLAISKVQSTLSPNGTGDFRFEIARPHADYSCRLSKSPSARQLIQSTQE